MQFRARARRVRFDDPRSRNAEYIIGVCAVARGGTKLNAGNPTYIIWELWHRTQRQQKRTQVAGIEGITQKSVIKTTKALHD